MKMLLYSKRKGEFAPPQLDLRRPSGLTLLHLAASLDMPFFLTALLSAGADPNMLDNNGYSPMHHAAMNGNEGIIDKLRSHGGDHRLRSLRNFVPADLATTLLAYQATMRPYQHSRSRSQGDRELGLSSHNNSSKSLSSFWEDSSVSSADSGIEELTAPNRPKLPYAQPGLFSVSQSRQASRRGSRHQEMPSQALVQTTQGAPEQAASSLMNAWRQVVNMTQAQQTQLSEQLQHLQESFPLPDYQNNNMMRRMSALLPPWANTNTDTTAKEGWWDSFKRSQSPTSNAPPSYDELYPDASQHGDTDTKKELAMQAAADAAVDQHFSQQELEQKTALGQMPTSEAFAEENEKIQRVSIRQDRKLFLFWVSSLFIVSEVIITNKFYRYLCL